MPHRPWLLSLCLDVGPAHPVVVREQGCALGFYYIFILHFLFIFFICFTRVPALTGPVGLCYLDT